MSIITDVIKENKESNFDKEAYKKQKQDENKRLYEMVEEAAPLVVSDAKNFEQYLNIESSNDQYSSRNLLLVFAQKPDATLIKDKKVWKQEHMYKKIGEEEIVIKEPDGEYTNSLDVVCTNYMSKYMLDISQINTQKKPVKETYDDRTRLLLLVSNTPVSFAIKNDLPDDAYAFYNPDDKTIYAQEDLESDTAFSAIAKEVAHAVMDKDDGSYNRQETNMHAYCCAYMLCKKFELDVSKFDFNYVKDVYAGREVDDIKKDLSSLRDSYSKMSEYVNLAIYKMKEKQKNEKTRER